MGRFPRRDHAANNLLLFSAGRIYSRRPGRIRWNERRTERLVVASFTAAVRHQGCRKVRRPSVSGNYSSTSVVEGL